MPRSLDTSQLVHSNIVYATVEVGTVRLYITRNNRSSSCASAFYSPRGARDASVERETRRDSLLASSPAPRSRFAFTETLLKMDRATQKQATFRELRISFCV